MVRGQGKRIAGEAKQVRGYGIVSVMSSEKSEQSLAGQVALVTGSARRLGRAVAVRLAQDGADVIIHHRTSTVDAQSAVAETEKLGRRSCAIAADLTNVAEIKRLFDETV